MKVIRLIVLCSIFLSNVFQFPIYALSPYSQLYKDKNIALVLSRDSNSLFFFNKFEELYFGENLPLINNVASLLNHLWSSLERTYIRPFMLSAEDKEFLNKKVKDTTILEIIKTLKQSEDTWLKVLGTEYKQLIEEGKIQVQVQNKEKIKEILKETPYPDEHCNKWRGYLFYKEDDCEIGIDKNLAILEAIKVLMHEWVHYELENKGIDFPLGIGEELSIIFEEKIAQRLGDKQRVDRKETKREIEEYLGDIWSSQESCKVYFAKKKEVMHLKRITIEEVEFLSKKNIEDIGDPRSWVKMNELVDKIIKTFVEESGVDKLKSILVKKKIKVGEGGNALEKQIFSTIANIYKHYPRLPKEYKKWPSTIFGWIIEEENQEIYKGQRPLKKELKAAEYEIEGISIEEMKVLKKENIRDLKDPENWTEMNKLVDKIIRTFVEENGVDKLKSILVQKKINIGKGEDRLEKLIFSTIANIYKHYPRLPKNLKGKSQSKIFGWIIEEGNNEIYKGKRAKKKEIKERKASFTIKGISIKEVEYLDIKNIENIGDSKSWTEMNKLVDKIIRTFVEEKGVHNLFQSLTDKKIKVVEGENVLDRMIFGTIGNLYRYYPKLPKEYKTKWPSTIFGWIIKEGNNEIYKGERAVKKEFKSVDYELKGISVEEVEYLKKNNVENIGALESWTEMNNLVDKIIRTFIEENGVRNLISSLTGKKIKVGEGGNDLEKQIFVTIGNLYRHYPNIPTEYKERSSSIIFGWIIEEGNKEIYSGERPEKKEKKERKARFQIKGISIEEINYLKIQNIENLKDPESWIEMNKLVDKIIRSFVEENKVEKLIPSLAGKKIKVGEGDYVLEKGIFGIIGYLYKYYPNLPEKYKGASPSQIFGWIIEEGNNEIYKGEKSARKEKNEIKAEFHLKGISKEEMEFLNIKNVKDVKKSKNWIEMNKLVEKIIRTFVEENGRNNLISSLAFIKIKVGEGDYALGKYIFGTIGNLYRYYPNLPKEYKDVHKGKIFGWVIENIARINLESEYTEQELKEKTNRYGIEDLINIFGELPGDLNEAINILYPEISVHERHKLIRSYAKLNLGEGFSPDWSVSKSKPYYERERALIEAILKREEIIAKLDRNKKKRLIDIYIRYKGIEFENDYKEAETILEERLKNINLSELEKELCEKVLSYYQKIHNKPILFLKDINLRLFQKIGIEFLKSHRRCILADSQGLGKTIQAIGAVESSEFKRVLIICPNRVKSSWKEHILKYTNNAEDQVAVLEGSTKEKLELIKSNPNAKYIIINYEFLRYFKGKSEEYIKSLFGKIDLLIADEVQKADNPKEEVKQAEGLRKIKSERMWYLSATPYYDKPEHMYTILNNLEPENWGSYEEFKDIYCRDENGKALLGEELKRLMLRRTQNQVVSELLIPKRNEIEVYYELSKEQCEILREMLTEYETWARKYNKKVKKENQIDIANINPLSKLTRIIQVTFDSRWVGGKEESPSIKKIKEIIIERMKKEEKIVLYTVNKEVINELSKWLEEIGENYSRIDGTVTIKEQEEEQRKFIEDKKVKVCLTNIKSGGLGLTLPADVNIYAQFPYVYTDKDQCDYRSIRLGVNRKKVDVINIIPKYPQWFIDEIKLIKNKKKRKILKEAISGGTVVELQLELLKSKGIDYRLVMEGFGGLAGYEPNIRNILANRLNLKAKEKRREKIAKEYYELWQRAKNKKEKKIVESLAAYYTSIELDSENLLNTVKSIEEFKINDLEEILALFEMPNKWLRNELLTGISEIIKKIYDSGYTLKELGEKIPYKQKAFLKWRLLIVSFGRQWENEKGEASGIVLELLKKIEEEKKDKLKRKSWKALTELMVKEAANDLELLSFFERNQDIILKMETEGTIKLYESLRFIKEIQIKEYFAIVDNKYKTEQELIKEVKNTYHDLLLKSTGLEEEYGEIIRKYGYEYLDPIIGVMSALQNRGEKEEIDQFKSIVNGIFDRKYTELRNNNKWCDIEYKRDDEKFWGIWQEERREKIKVLTVNEELSKNDLRESVQEFKELLLSKDMYDNEKELEENIEKNLIEIREVGILYGKLSKEEDREKLQNGRNYLSYKRKVLTILKRVEELLDTEIGSADKKRIEREIIKRINESVEYIIKIEWSYGGREELNERMLTLRDNIKSYGESKKFKDIEIVDTDDPFMILRQGSFHPDMITCLDYHNGLGERLIGLVNMISGKNQRIIVVKNIEGEEIAVCRAKIRQEENKEPVIFIEKGYNRVGYDFKEEILNHLKYKAKNMKAKLAFQTNKKKGEGIINVTETGKWNTEYVGALFGFRKNVIKHIAQVYYDPTSKIERVPVVGIGTGARGIESFIVEAQDKGIKKIVDIRTTPRSGYYPYFNKSRFKKKLEENGIGYIWVGDILGGRPKGYESFGEYMQGHEFTQAMNRLIELIEDQDEGKIGICCSESNEKNCHRRFILREIYKRLGFVVENTQMSLFDIKKTPKDIKVAA
ncbi:hypothetical protein BVX93_01110 [bacterium B13(2017)]|nr:hypothetical protein BVX93_01110 [bacterium B13(2017)]